MAARGEVRIISGQWRGRRLQVPDQPGLRPTPDRVRETLFNWLAPLVPGAYCLDLFAGSGALGFEAASRGAAEAVLVDASPAVVSLLQAEADKWRAENVTVQHTRIPDPLPIAVAREFDIVFLDPPYQMDLLPVAYDYLERHRYLAPVSHIYLEARRVIEDNELPLGWRILKQQQAGQVFYHLARREKTSNE